MDSTREELGTAYGETRDESSSATRDEIYRAARAACDAAAKANHRATDTARVAAAAARIAMAASDAAYATFVAIQDAADTARGKISPVTYEIRPSCSSRLPTNPPPGVEPRTYVEPCSPELANFWAVYSRPVVPDERGDRFARWLGDFYPQAKAETFVRILESANTPSAQAAPQKKESI